MIDNSSGRNGSFSAKDLVQRDIGEKLAAEFVDIQALLALLNYRENEAAGVYNYGLQRIFDTDTVFGKKPLWKIICGFLSPVLWIFVCIKYFFKKEADIRIAFSNTFLSSKRYPMVRNQVEEKYGCTAIVAFLDNVLRNSKGDIRKALKASLSLDFGRCKPVFLFSYSVSGVVLKYHIKKYYTCLHNKNHYNAILDEKELEKILCRLEKAYKRRLQYLTKAFARSKIQIYITVNQYNLRDLLIIHACKNLGIRTMQQEHHAMQFSRSKFDVNKPVPRLSFVSEYAFWSHAEKFFHQSVFQYDNVLNPSLENRFLVSGNTELSYEQAISYQKEYPAKRKLTYMTSALSDYELKDIFEKYEKWRWDIFKGLRELSQRQNIQICIRYTPYKEQYFREKEIPVLKDWGFLVSESLPETLMEEMCSSIAIMSSTSSVLATSRALGKLTYRIEDIELEHIRVDPEIHDIKVSEIATLSIPENLGRVEHQLDKKSFFDIDNIVER